MDPEALDEFDLDGMFADDGDILFDDLDIPLEGMSEIIAPNNSTPNTSYNNNNDNATTNRRSSGPRTMRPPARDKDGNEAGGMAAAAAAKVAEEEATLARRKTKRKTKTPVAFGDDDDDYMEEVQPKKKGRKSKSQTTSVAPPPVPPPMPPPPPPPQLLPSSKKTKSGTGKTTTTSKKSISSPPSTDPRAATTTTSNTTVAAAGRFGKRGSAGGGGGPTTTKLTKRKSQTLEDIPPAPIIPSYMPKHESTYGGLPPSRTHFYPFMESVPPEPTLKSRKQYPQMDRVFAAFTGYMSVGGTNKDGGGGTTTTTNNPSSSSSTPTVGDLSVDSPIMQLLIESFEAISDKDKAAFGDAKKQAMLTCLPNIRNMIQSTDPVKFLPELYSMCGLLTRQYNFVKTCLTNMELWCKQEFSNTDFCQAFSLPEPFQPEKVGTTIASSNRRWKKQIINVKIAFLGHKEVKGAPVLQAKMPLALVIHADKKKPEAPVAKKTKGKEKTPGPSTTATKSSSAASHKALPTPKTYADLPPNERRQRILERVAQLTVGLEGQLNSRRAKRTPYPLPGSMDVKKMPLSASYIPPEDPPLHTARMWEWVETAGFFQASLSSESQSLRDARLGLQSPEIDARRVLLPTSARIRGRTTKDDDESPRISSLGLFDRLQSLLVAEGDGENDIVDMDRDAMEDDSDLDSDTDDDESLGFLDESDDDDDDDGLDRRHLKKSTMDLSELSLEERTFLHLCRVGLIKKPLFRHVELVLEEEDDDEEDEDDVVDVIGKMNADLSTLTTRNNSRINYLETVMDPMNLAYRKQVEEEHANFISRCQSLLKRSKEKTKKSNKQKSAVAANKDDLDLPW